MGQRGKRGYLEGHNEKVKKECITLKLREQHLDQSIESQHYA